METNNLWLREIVLSPMGGEALLQLWLRMEAKFIDGYFEGFSIKQGSYPRQQKDQEFI